MVDIETPTPSRTEHKFLLLALQDKREGKIKQDELSKICYLWTLQYAWDDMKFSPLPTILPELFKWREMNDKVKKLLDDHTLQYYKNLAYGYNQSYGVVDNHNKVKLQWLREMGDWFGDDKPEIRKRINEFEERGCRIEIKSNNRGL